MKRGRRGYGSVKGKLKRPYFEIPCVLIYGLQGESLAMNTPLQENGN